MQKLNKNLRTKTTCAPVVPFEEKGVTEIHEGVPGHLGILSSQREEEYLEPESWFGVGHQQHLLEHLLCPKSLSADICVQRSWGSLPALG